MAEFVDGVESHAKLMGKWKPGGGAGRQRGVNHPGIYRVMR